MRRFLLLALLPSLTLAQTTFLDLDDERDFEAFLEAVEETDFSTAPAEGEGPCEVDCARAAEACKSVLPGTFDEDGFYHTDDPEVDRLYDDRGDFKTFYEFSLRGYGGAAGVAYEFSDKPVPAPFGKKWYRSKSRMRRDGTCPKSWTPDGDECVRRRMWGVTKEVGLSEKSFGLHLGFKFTPIADVGVFIGPKYNFNHSDLDFVVGLQWLRLDF